jgi:site-specific recombinase XerC
MIHSAAWSDDHNRGMAREHWIRPGRDDPSGIRDVRDHALFWLIYDGGLRCNEALAINLEDIDWSERAIRIQGKGDHSCEMFFSRRVSRYLDDYLKQRGQPTVGRCSSPPVKLARPAAPI